MSKAEKRTKNSPIGQKIAQNNHKHINLKKSGYKKIFHLIDIFRPYLNPKYSLIWPIMAPTKKDENQKVRKQKKSQNKSYKSI